MTVGVRLSRMGRTRGRNLYAEYGEPFRPKSISESIKTGNTTNTGQTIYAGAVLAGTVISAAYGGGGGGGSIDAALMIGDITPLGILFSKLFGVKHQQKIYGKEYSEFQLFNSKYGIPITEGDGNIRVAGNVIWTTAPKEVIITQEQVLGDAPLTFLEYKSRAGLTQDQLLSGEIQYVGLKGLRILAYKEWHYTINFAVAFANIKSFPGEIVRIWADKEIIWDVRASNLNEPTQLMTVGFRDSAFHTFYKNTIITVYNGKHTDRDPTIVADKGEDTPAYKNICYAVFNKLDLNDFNGRIPIIEAEIAFRSSPVKYSQGLGIGSEGSIYNTRDVGWVHDTTDGYLIGAVNYPHYYDLDVYDCFAYKSPIIYNRGNRISSVGMGAGIHGIKYGYIYTELSEYGGATNSGGNAYINRSTNKTSIWKNLVNLSAFPIPKYAVYNYDYNGFDGVGGIFEASRKVIYAYGLFGTAIVKSYMFDQGMQAQGLIWPDDMIQIPTDNDVAIGGNKILTVGYNNQAGGLNTSGDIGGLLLDRIGSYRITTDYGPFGSHGPPTVLWNTEYLGPIFQGSNSSLGLPWHTRETVISETGSAGILTLLEDHGQLPNTDINDNSGLLVIQAGTLLYHFNTTLDIGTANYTGIVKTSTITPTLDSSSAQQLPMGGLLPAHTLFSNPGGLYRMVNCIELDYTGTDWSTATLYANPNGIAISPPAATPEFHWFTVMGMSATSYLGSPLYMCKYRYSAANPTLAQVVSEIILSKLPHIKATDLDVTTLTDIVRGYMMADTSNLVEYIERLRKGYFFDATEADGKLKFIKRGVISTIIPIEETLIEDPVKGIVQSVADMAKEGVLNYADFDFDYLQNAQRHRRESAKSLNIIENTLPIVYTANEAAKVAKIYINGSYAEAIEIQATIDRSYSYLQCTDIISIGIFSRIRLTNIIMLQDGGMQIQGVTEDAQIYNTTAVGVPILNYKSLRRLSSSKIQVFPFETPYLWHQIDETLGYVYVVAMKRFTDSAISISIASGSNTYRYIGSTNPTKIIGRVINRLLPPNYSVKHATWDYINYIDFYLHQGEVPISATKEQVYLGANRLRVGREILSFTTVELVSENRYKLTGLLRGRDGTENFTRAHNTGEYLLEMYEDMPRFTITESMRGSTIFIRGSERFNIELLGSYVIRGIALAPAAPANISAVNSGNDIVISWIRKNAAKGELTPYTEIAQGTITSYSVDILANDMTIKRTITSSVDYCAYTEAQQVTDFGSIQASISLIAYQHTPTIKGYGTYANINISLPNYYTDFSSGTVGVQPSNITIREGSYVTCTTELDYLNNKVLQLATQWVASTPTSSYITLDSLNNRADGDLRFSFTYDQFYGYTQGGSLTLLYIYLKGKDTKIELTTSGSIICSSIGLLDEVVTTDIETYSYSAFVKNIKYNVRVQYFEETIRVKIWTKVEPSTWLFEYFPEIIASQPSFSFNISGAVGFGTKSYRTNVLIKDLEFNDLY